MTTALVLLPLAGVVAVCYARLGLHALRRALTDGSQRGAQLQRSPSERQRALARGFHVPIWWCCVAMLVFRLLWVALCFILAQNWFVEHALMWQWAFMAAVVCLDMPSVVLVALYGHVILFLVQLVHFQVWATRPTKFQWGRAIYWTVCSLMACCVLLWAWLHSLIAPMVHPPISDESSSAVDDDPALAELYVLSTASLVYGAIVWAAIGSMLLRYQSKAMELLMNEDNLRIRRVLGNVHHLTVHLMLLAFVPLARSLYCILGLIMRQTALARLLQRPIVVVDMQLVASSLMQHIIWELAIMFLAIRLLERVPTQVPYCDVVFHSSVGNASASAPVIEWEISIPGVTQIVDEHFGRSAHSLWRSLAVIRDRSSGSCNKRLEDWELGHRTSVSEPLLTGEAAVIEDARGCDRQVRLDDTDGSIRFD